MSRFCATSAMVVALIVMTFAPWAAAQEHADDPDAPAAEADHGGAAAHGEMPNPMAFSPDLAIFSAVVFLLLVFILGKFAWPQIALALDERERKIADNIEAAAAKHEQAKQLLAEHEARLAAAAGDVRAVLEEARRDAEHTKSRIVEDARKAASEEFSRAAREIERAKDGALHDLAIVSANLAIDLGRQVVREQLEISPEYQARIVRDALGKLASTASNQN